MNVNKNPFLIDIKHGMNSSKKQRNVLEETLNTLDDPESKGGNRGNTSNDVRIYKPEKDDEAIGKHIKGYEKDDELNQILNSVSLINLFKKGKIGSKKLGKREGRNGPKNKRNGEEPKKYRKHK